MRLGGWVLPLGWVWKMGLPFLIFGEQRGKDEIVNTIASQEQRYMCHSENWLSETETERIEISYVLRLNQDLFFYAVDRELRQRFPQIATYAGPEIESPGPVVT